MNEPILGAAMSQDAEELFYVNGINASTGKYLEAPFNADEITALVEQSMKSQSPSEAADLQKRSERSQLTWATALGVDAGDLAQAGWGVIFAKSVDAACRAALNPLLEYRKGQAGPLYHVYSGDDSYLPGDTWNEYRARHGIGSGLADPKEMPYYLLIVGSPEEIPFTFQYNLDLERAVGRIYFEDAEGYARYAQSVVDAERGMVQHTRNAVVFATSNPDDKATALSSQELASPIAGELSAELAARPDDEKWKIDLIAPQSATKSTLAELLGGSKTPAFLFTATHGVGFNIDDPHQFDRQGALVTQDWAGPLSWQGPLDGDKHYFSAADLTDNAQVWGMIAALFACYGAGTPATSDFIHRREIDNRERLEVAKHSFMAQLPQRLLSHRNGGALAVLGHVDRAWDNSFRLPKGIGRDIGPMKRMMKVLLLGYPLGYALEELNSHYAQASVDLSQQLYDITYKGIPVTSSLKFDIARLWTTTNDARNYLVVGDPAVRLPLGTKNSATWQPVTPAIEVLDRANGAPVSPPPVNGSTPSSTPPKSPMESSGQPLGATAGSTEAEGDHPFSPAPTPPDHFKEDYPELYAAWVEHIKDGYRNNDRVFHSILKGFLRSHYSTLVMNWLLFLVGVGLFLTAVIVALVNNAPVTGAVFGGLSVVTFLLYFISGPVQAVEQNLLFLTWVGIIYNSYWTHLAWSFDRKTAQQELNDATTAGEQQIQVLLDRHARALKERPRLFSR